MANKQLFASLRGKALPPTDTTNSENARAYPRTQEAALAQLATTGCLNGTYYASASDQLDRLIDLAGEVSTEYLARTAVYSRTVGLMKDTPAVLLAVLSRRDGTRFEQIFDRVVDNGRMLRTFVQVMRSGATGRKSLGSRPKRCIQRWITNRSDTQLFRDSVGNAPSMADVVKLARPSPTTPTRNALYAWLLSKPYDPAQLPELTQRYESWKEQVAAGGMPTELPDAPFQMLTALPLDRSAWSTIARRAPWQMTRMNLNTFLRQGVFTDDADGRACSEMVAERLQSEDLIRKAKVFPYQLLAAHLYASPELPQAIRDALAAALELATQNVPAFEGRVAVCPDVSGSMLSPVTGSRRGATTAMRCVDVAGLLAATVLRKNLDARVLPFENEVVDVRINPRDTVMTNAERLAAVGGGGTAVSAPLRVLAEQKIDLVILISDNESWIDATRSRYRNDATASMKAWAQIKRNNPSAKLVCIDLQPGASTQVAERADVLNIGGFSDSVFELIAAFAAGRMSTDFWVGAIRSVALEPVPAQ